MSWIAVGAAVVGGVSSAYGASQAAGAQSDAANKAGAMSYDMWNQTRQLNDPFIGEGYDALKALKQQTGSLPGGGYDPNAPLARQFTLADFKASPGYQFNLQQGTDALNKAANARGNFFAPQTLKDLSGFTQGMASNEFNNERNYFTNWQQRVFGNLFNMSAAGQNAVNQQGQFGMTAAGNAASAGMQAGDARAAGIMGATNAFTGTLGDVTNMYLQQRMLQQNQGVYGGQYIPNQG